MYGARRNHFGSWSTSESEIAAIDIAILGTYVLGTRIVLGSWFAARTREGGAEDDSLAGRRMAWPIHWAILLMSPT